MKTILEQKVFNFSSLFVAACLVIYPIWYLLEDQEFLLASLFILSSLLFLLFICRLNLKLHKLNGFVSAFITTYLGYTFLVVVYSVCYIFTDLSLDISNNLLLSGVFLLYGYFFNLAISLIVYILYKAIMFFKNYKS